MSDDLMRELERRALADPGDDAAWREWREALALEGNPREAIMRRVVKDARRFRLLEDRARKWRAARQPHDADQRVRALVYFLAGAHASCARSFRRGLQRLRAISASGQRISPKAIAEALGLGDADVAALKVAFEKAMPAAGEAKKATRAANAPTVRRTVLQRILERGLNPASFHLPSVGRRASDAHLARHGSRPNHQSLEPTNHAGLVSAYSYAGLVSAYSYAEEDMDLVDAAIDASVRP